MKKIHLPLYSKCVFPLAAIALLFYAVLVGMKSRDLYLYFETFSSDEMMPVILFIAAILLVSACAVWACKLVKHKAAIVAIIVGAVVILLIVIFVFYIMAFLSSSNKYNDFYSNDSIHYIVVKEEAWLRPMGGTIYEVTAPGIMTLVGNQYGYSALSDSEYFFEWGDHSFILHFNNGDEVVLPYAK